MTQPDPFSPEPVALLVLDMQERFLKAIPGRDSLLKRNAFAISAARLLGLRIFFTEQSPDKLGHTHADLLKAAESAEKPASVYAKTAFSALEVEELVEDLHAAHIQHLLIAGIEVPICVYQTALQAIEEEFEITLLKDCLGGRREEDFQPVFSLLQIHGAFLLPSEAVYYSMIHSAGHPLFREFTELVKN